jgi:hypothetical protein
MALIRTRSPLGSTERSSRRNSLADGTTARRTVSRLHAKSFVRSMLFDDRRRRGRRTPFDNKGHTQSAAREGLRRQEYAKPSLDPRKLFPLTLLSTVRRAAYGVGGDPLKSRYRRRRCCCFCC